MNTPTLSQLADIGAAAASLDNSLQGDHFMRVSRDNSLYTDDAPAREAFVQAVLDAVGYKFPVDPEREAFDAWVTTAGWDLRDSPFEAWKAGRAAMLASQVDHEVVMPHPDSAKPAPETFEAHGLTWFKHTPGDPCPCKPVDNIQVLVSHELRGHFDPDVQAAEDWGDQWESAKDEYALIGWRYADTP